MPYTLSQKSISIYKQTCKNRTMGLWKNQVYSLQTTDTNSPTHLSIILPFLQLNIILTVQLHR